MLVGTGVGVGGGTNNLSIRTLPINLTRFLTVTNELKIDPFGLKLSPTYCVSAVCLISLLR